MKTSKSANIKRTLCLSFFLLIYSLIYNSLLYAFPLKQVIQGVMELPQEEVLTCAQIPPTRPVGSFPGQCASQCPNGITVVCSESSAYMGVPTLGGCTIEVGSILCDLLGFQNGNTYPVSEINSLSQCQGKVRTPLQADLCCTFRHELLHACDKNNQLAACSETEGNEYYASCMQAVSNYYCDGSKNSPRWEQYSCRQLCSTFSLDQVVNKIWDSCNCEISKASKSCGTSFNVQACCNCASQCSNPTRIASLVPSACKAYLTDADYTNAINTCQGYGNDSNHSCRYYLNHWNGTFDDQEPLCTDKVRLDVTETAQEY
jgi:hypothetical protein